MHVRRLFGQKLMKGVVVPEVGSWVKIWTSISSTGGDIVERRPSRLKHRASVLKLVGLGRLEVILVFVLRV